MAIAVTPNLTDISLCESTTGWTGAGGTNSDFALQGTYCLGLQVKNTTSTTIYYTPGSALNLTGKHVYLWVLVTGMVDTIANGGIRMYAYTDASNYSYWYVGGSDNYRGGWQCFTLDPTASRSSGLGTLNVASIARIGLQFKTTTTIAGTTYNCFFDAFRYGTGLTVTSGATDAIDMEDIYTYDTDSTRKYGVVTKEASGTYVINGKLILGGTGAEHIDFADTGQIYIFPANSFVGTSFYGLTVQCGTGTSNFQLGTKSGDAGINGCIIKASGVKEFTCDLSDSDNDKIAVYGSTFINGGAINLPPAGASNEVLNCSFVNCDEVAASTCEVANCNIIAADDEGMTIGSTSFDVTDSQFIGNPNGVRITAAGTYAFDGLTFSGNTVDIDNTSGGAVLINCSNGSNPVTETGDTTISNPVTTEITVKDSEGTLLTGARVFLRPTDNTGPLPFEESVSIVASGTTATVTHTAHGIASGKKVLVKGCTQTEYNGTFTVTVTDANTYTYTMGGSPSSPATGTPIATGIVFNDLTSSGVVTDVRTMAAAQDVVGWVRYAPDYKTGAVSGTISTTAGMSATVQLVSDA